MSEEKKINDGGFAFPGFEQFTDNRKFITGEPFYGLTKRELCAFMAMQGYIASGESDSEKIKKWSYEQADIMLAAGEKK